MVRSARRTARVLGLALLATTPACFLIPSAAGIAASSASNTSSAGSAAPEAAPAQPPPEAPAEPPEASTEPPEPPEIDLAPPSKNLPDLRLSIGSRHEGGDAPIALARLTRAMTRTDVDALYPGAKRVSRFGFSKVRVKEPPGVAAIEFYFTKEGKLYSAKLQYKPSLTSAAFGEYFTRVVKNKYGESSGGEILSYAKQSGVLVQATKFRGYYELSYVPPSD